ncbi:Saccharopine dehydrogenase [Lecanora helva]
MSTLHLRSETKPLEHRSALTPSTVRQLLEKDFVVNVERSPVRIFDDEEFEKVGANLVPEGSWPDAPQDHIIIGLKELPEENFPLKHTHIQFAHCYKGQGGWKEVLRRFPAGGGMLYDMEFLEKDGRRVAAFGFHAGFAGSALAILDWAWQLEHNGKPLPGVKPYENEQLLIDEVKTHLKRGLEKTQGVYPRILVIGALGRCGTGALELARRVGIPEDKLLQWDLEETKEGGPFEEIRGSDIFINCIYLSQDVPKFITKEFLQVGNRRLSVVCDVSCDTTNPRNPIPFCNRPTYFNSPTISLPEFDNPALSYITIDHLPSLLPREASEAFSTALVPSLLQLNDRAAAPVWQGAENLFREKVRDLERSEQLPGGVL